MKNEHKNKLPSASKIRILSFNPNSIGKNPKRTTVLQAIKKKNANIILLSDTRLSHEIEPLVRAEWGGKANFASFTSQARGVAVFFTKRLETEKNMLLHSKNVDAMSIVCKTYLFQNFYFRGRSIQKWLYNRETK